MNNKILTIKHPVQYKWDPKPDISAYELALCVPLLIFSSIDDVEKTIDNLPPGAQRHFVKVTGFTTRQEKHTTAR